MGTYMGLLLLVLPGYVARKIYKQTNDIRDDLSQFEETMYCLLNSITIFAVMFIIIGIASFWIPEAANKFSAASLTVSFDSIGFIAIYGTAAFLLAALLGRYTAEILAAYTRKINKIRAKKKLETIIISETIFDAVFNDPKEEIAAGIPPHVAVFKDDKFIGRGILKLRNEHYKEFYLEDAEQDFKYLEDERGKLPPYKGIYLDSKIGLVIKIYDITRIPDSYLLL